MRFLMRIPETLSAAPIMIACCTVILMIFVDTGVWFARFVRRDPNHVRVTEWFTAKTQPLLTSDYCVDETLTLLSARERPQLAIDAGRELFDQTVSRIHYLSVDQISHAWIIFQHRAAAGWSFTDCTSKVLIDKLNMKSAASLDQHFLQFGIDVVP
jgi:predicted nucleic acid-binding protein